MPGKFIVFIFFLIVIGTFVGFNINNNSDIRIWIGERGLLSNVPILFSFFVMYVFGLISAFPFIIAGRIKKAVKEVQRKKTAAESEKEANEPVRILGAKPLKESEESESEEGLKNEN